MTSRLRPIALLLAIMLAGVCVTEAKVKSADPQPQATTADSLNRSIAVVMAANLDEVLTDLARSGVNADRAEVGKYIANIMGGEDLGISRLYANAFVENMIRSNRPDRPSSLSTESQQAFLEEASKVPGAVVLPSGVVFIVIQEGEGVMPKESDTVKVNYVGRLSDGLPFDDTEGESVEFNLANVIPGFSEGVQQMKPGGTYRIVIPPNMAYGDAGAAGVIPGNAALDFVVTLEQVIPGK